MADKRISQLIERTDIANNDVLPIVASGATTTNKVTISTLQDWMQENIDLGVTSVGITLGATGTDVNVTGSPITSSGNITINIPDASATARGVVTTGTQTFAGYKIFTGTIGVNNDIQLATQGTALNTFIKNVNASGITSIGSNGFGFNNANNIYFSGSSKGGGIFAFNNTGNQTYTLQNASGTLAFTSDLTGYVTLDTAQTITAQKTFTTSGSSDTMIISHGSGSGIALDVIKAGNGEGIRVTKTSGTGNAVTISGGNLSAEAGQFSGDLQSATRVIAAASSQSIILTPNSGGTTNRVESIGTLPLALVSAAAITMAAGGTTPQITLNSNGTTDFVTTTSSFATMNSTNANGGVLSFRRNGTNVGHIGNSAQLGGGVLDAIEVRSGVGSSVILKTDGGQLTLATGGAATFSSSVTAASLSGAFATLSNYGSATSTALQLGDANNGLFRPALNSVAIATNGAASLTIASTGAATFSSSVTAAGNITVNGSGIQSLIAQSSGSDALVRLNNTTTTTGKNFYITSTSAGNLQIVGTNSIATFLDSGNVGIGTASPDGRFKVVGSSGAQIIVDLNGTNQNYFDADTTIFRSYGGGGFPERMCITSVGNTQPGADNAYSLGVSGTRWSAVWAANGTIQTSDQREKKDIVDSDLGLDLITKLRPVSFKWKVGQNVVTSQVVKDEEGNPILDEEGNEKTESVIIPREGKRTHYGLIAQEVEEVLDGKDFGGFIHDEETDTKGLRYDQFVPLLIKSIQELNDKIAILESKLK